MANLFKKNPLNLSKNISNQVNQRVISELMSNVSMKEISLHNNISQTQVARILDKTIVFDYRQYESLPKHQILLTLVVDGL